MRSAPLWIACLAALALSGCAGQAPSPGRIDLSGFGIDNAAKAPGDWAALVLPAIANGTAAGFDFQVPANASGLADAGIQVTPALPPGMNLTKLAALVLARAEGSVSATQTSTGLRPQSAQATPTVEAGYRLVSSFATADVEATSTPLQGAATTELRAALAGPVTLQLDGDVRPGDVLKVVVAVQGTVDAAATATQDAAEEAAADAAVLVSFVRSGAEEAAARTYRTAQEARAAATAAGQALAAKGYGTAVKAIGTAHGLAVPVFQRTVDGVTGVVTLVKSVDAEAVVSDALSAADAAASSAAVTVSADGAPGGFLMALGGASAEVGRFSWNVQADVHGQRLADAGDHVAASTARVPVLGSLPGAPGAASAAFQVLGSGVGDAAASFTAQTTGRDTAGALAFAGIGLGGSLQQLVGVSPAGVAVSGSQGIDVPGGVPGRIVADGPIGHAVFAL